MRRCDFSSPFALALVALVACSPVFNWRAVPLGDDGVTALLPCKPDRAKRTLPLGAEMVELEMIGCKAGGATFALARTPPDTTSQAQARLEAWRAATRDQWTGGQSGAGAVFAEQAAGHPRAAPVPAPLAMQVRLQPGAPTAEGPARTAGPEHDGAAQARILWFAHGSGDGTLVLYQATVLGRPNAADAAVTFFEGIALP